MTHEDMSDHVGDALRAAVKSARRAAADAEQALAVYNAELDRIDAVDKAVTDDVWVSPPDRRSE